MNMKTIELDCAPGTLRPGNLIEGVVEGTVLEGKLKDPISKLFGNWTWGFEVTDDEWAAAQAVTKPRIVALYNSGIIRYGSW